MNCLRSFGRWDPRFESRSGHRCLVRVCVYFVFVLSCVCVAALRRADHSSRESYRLWKMITELNKRSGHWVSWKSHLKKVLRKPHSYRLTIGMFKTLSKTTAVQGTQWTRSKIFINNKITEEEKDFKYLLAKHLSPENSVQVKLSNCKRTDAI
jgi:hypothetical protein